MLIEGIKICFYCIFAYNGVNSPLICDFVEPVQIEQKRLLWLSDNFKGNRS